MGDLFIILASERAARGKECYSFFYSLTVGFQRAARIKSKKKLQSNEAKRKSFSQFISMQDEKLIVYLSVTVICNNE